MSETSLASIDNKDNNVLAISKPLFTTNSNVKQKILEEEDYLSILEDIVERDFYPELSKLKLRTEYLYALDNNDLEKLREIQLKLEKGTPDVARRQTPRTFEVDDAEKEVDDKSQSLQENVSLDKFLLKNTSEDNASFEKIMEATRKKHREKYAWLHEKQLEQESKQASALALPLSNEEQLRALEGLSNNVETWKYVPRNALMYVPDGVELSLEEHLEEKGSKEQTIRYQNTRFNVDPFDSEASQASLLRAARDVSNMKKSVGKVGVDGRLEQSDRDVPKVRGYGFVATPSPAPGVDASPLMTWGEIEGTPLRVDATPGNAPSFKIPEPPRREKLAHSLAEKASKQHREKRRKAFAAATASLLSPRNSPRHLASERLSKLSPAAQKLVKTNVRLPTDKTLRASYSPSPLLRNLQTPSPKSRTPGSRRAVKTPSNESSITDNLLQLPIT